MKKRKKIPLDLLKRAAGDAVYNRGVRYYQEGLVVDFEMEHNLVNAIVFGNSFYDVELEFEKDGSIRTACTCPYDWGNICKHVVATVLKYNELIEQGNDSVKKDEKVTWKDFVEMEEDNKMEELDKTAKGRVLFFVILQSSVGWQLAANRYYVKKDGTYGRKLNLDLLNISAKKDEGEVSASELVALQYLASKGYGYSDPIANFQFGSDFGGILKLLKGSEVYLNTKDGHRLEFEENCRLSYNLEKSKNDYRFSLKIICGDMEKTVVKDKYMLLTTKPVHLLGDDFKIYQFDKKLQPRHILPFTKEENAIVIKNSEIAQFVNRVYMEISGLDVEFNLPDELRINEIDEITGKEIYLSEEDGELRVKPIFYYGEEKIRVNALPYKNRVSVVHNERNYIIRRQQKVENASIDLLTENMLQYEADGEFRIKGKKDPIDWMFETLPLLSKSGFEILGEDKLDKLKIKRTNARIVSHVSGRQDWFDLKMDIDFDGMRISYFEILKSIRKKKKYIKLNDGSHVHLDDELIEKMGFVASFAAADSKKKKLRFSKNQALLLNEILETTTRGKVASNFKKQIKKLESFNEMKPAAVSKNFIGELRPYQKAGLDWLTFLRDYDFGGCLADDMGLGKTVQALALLQNEKDNKRGASLIVAPTSVISNWELEAARFTPDLKVLLYHGMDRLKDVDNLKKYDLVITSYAILLRDVNILNSAGFNYLILDESQKIKNPNSLTAKAARAMQVRHRLVMTGTPIENNLNELWAQFQFINPGMLGNNKNFQSKFAKLIERDGDEEKANQLKRIIYPFVMRRTKDLVLKELPPKVENVLFCDMDEYHKDAYNRWRDYYRMEILALIDEEGMEKSKIKILEGLTKLRQVSIHPRLVDESYRKTSGKTETLWDLLEDVRKEGHKALVFSQFVKALTLVRKRFDEENIPYCYLDGRTKNRQEEVDRFQTDEDIKIFLISLKAGGTGLNLTAADYVIHIDPWWNPAVENQATDRAHRMGQDKKVFVYKLITKGTVEEKILQLQEKKRDLANDLISSDAAFFKNISKDDIKTLFS